MRAYAQFDANKVKLARVPCALLIGKGYLAFTIDQGPSVDRYQGIVDLIGRDMAACVQTYFTQSEQIDTATRVFVEKNADGHWQAGAMMLQRLPHEGGYAANSNDVAGQSSAEERAEDWRRAVILMETLKQDEIFDPALDSARILHRLFHEEALELGDLNELKDQCRCSRPRVAMILSTLLQDELRDMVVDGKINVTCEFCSSSYDFEPEQFQKIVAGPGLNG
jgi:molecular chaperone Hsp33